MNTEEQIIQSLKDADRLEYGGKWLYWNTEWVVREHRYSQHGSTILYQGDSLLEALRMLLAEVGK